MSLRDRDEPEVLDALDGHGEETRIVGGAVRNALMGLPVTELISPRPLFRTR